MKGSSKAIFPKPVNVSHKNYDSSLDSVPYYQVASEASDPLTPSKDKFYIPITSVKVEKRRDSSSSTLNKKESSTSSGKKSGSTLKRTSLASTKDIPKRPSASTSSTDRRRTSVSSVRERVEKKIMNKPALSLTTNRSLSSISSTTTKKTGVKNLSSTTKKDENVGSSILYSNSSVIPSSLSPNGLERGRISNLHEDSALSSLNKADYRTPERKSYNYAPISLPITRDETLGHSPHSRSNALREQSISIMKDVIDDDEINNEFQNALDSLIASERERNPSLVIEDFNSTSSYTNYTLPDTRGSMYNNSSNNNKTKEEMLEERKYSPSLSTSYEIDGVDYGSHDYIDSNDYDVHEKKRNSLDDELNAVKDQMKLFDSKYNVDSILASSSHSELSKEILNAHEQLQSVSANLRGVKDSLRNSERSSIHSRNSSISSLRRKSVPAVLLDVNESLTLGGIGGGNRKRSISEATNFYSPKPAIEGKEAEDDRKLRNLILNNIKKSSATPGGGNKSTAFQDLSQKFANERKNRESLTTTTMPSRSRNSSVLSTTNSESGSIYNRSEGRSPSILHRESINRDGLNKISTRTDSSIIATSNKASSPSSTNRESFHDSIAEEGVNSTSARPQEFGIFLNNQISLNGSLILEEEERNHRNSIKKISPSTMEMENEKRDRQLSYDESNEELIAAHLKYLAKESNYNNNNSKSKKEPFYKSSSPLPIYTRVEKHNNTMSAKNDGKFEDRISQHKTSPSSSPAVYNLSFIDYDTNSLKYSEKEENKLLPNDKLSVSSKHETEDVSTSIRRSSPSSSLVYSFPASETPPLSSTSLPSLVNNIPENSVTREDVKIDSSSLASKNRFSPNEGNGGSLTYSSSIKMDTIPSSPSTSRTSVDSTTVPTKLDISVLSISPDKNAYNNNNNKNDISPRISMRDYSLSNPDTIVTKSPALSPRNILPSSNPTNSSLVNNIHLPTSSSPPVSSPKMLEIAKTVLEGSTSTTESTLIKHFNEIQVNIDGALNKASKEADTKMEIVSNSIANDIQKFFTDTLTKLKKSKDLQANSLVQKFESEKTAVLHKLKVAHSQESDQMIQKLKLQFGNVLKDEIEEKKREHLHRVTEQINTLTSFADEEKNKKIAKLQNDNEREFQAKVDRYKVILEKEYEESEKHLLQQMSINEEKRMRNAKDMMEKEYKLRMDKIAKEQLLLEERKLNEKRETLIKHYKEMEDKSVFELTKALLDGAAMNLRQLESKLTKDKDEKLNKIKQQLDNDYKNQCLEKEKEYELLVQKEEDVICQEAKLSIENSLSSLNEVLASQRECRLEQVVVDYQQKKEETLVSLTEVSYLETDYSVKQLQSHFEKELKVCVEERKAQLSLEIDRSLKDETRKAANKKESYLNRLNQNFRLHRANAITELRKLINQQTLKHSKNNNNIGFTFDEYERNNENIVNNNINNNKTNNNEYVLKKDVDILIKEMTIDFQSLQDQLDATQDNLGKVSKELIHLKTKNHIIHNDNNIKETFSDCSGATNEHCHTCRELYLVNKDLMDRLKVLEKDEDTK